MLQKKSVTKSKIFVTFLSFIVVLYGLFVGITYVKAQQDFKPYHKLAIELNDALGGGYTIKETKNCALSGIVCPSSELNMQKQFKSIDEITSERDNLKQHVIASGGTGVEKQQCSPSQGKTYCTFNANSKDGLRIAAVVTDDRSTLYITKSKSP